MRARVGHGQSLSSRSQSWQPFPCPHGAPGLGLRSERPVSVRVPTHGLLGLILLCRRAHGALRGCSGNRPAHTLESGRSLGLRLSRLSPSPALFSCDYDISCRHLLGPSSLVLMSKRSVFCPDGVWFPRLETRVAS